MLRIIRVSVYNLAGVPSIVFGGLRSRLFSSTWSAAVSTICFSLNACRPPTFGTPGLFWASLTLALLDAAGGDRVNRRRPGQNSANHSRGFAGAGRDQVGNPCGKVVIPLSAPAMMTGLILAVARAAGEVAPLMLVGVVKLAP